MRILWIKVGGLWPLDRGGRLRSFHIIKELSRRHRMVVLTTHGQGEDPRGLAQELPRCEKILSIPFAAAKQSSSRFAGALVRSWFSPLPVDLWKWFVPALRSEAERLVRTRAFDLCVADFLAALPNVPVDESLPLVFFAHNVEHMIWKRLSQVETQAWRRALLEVEWRKMRRCEAQACARANLTIAVSESDRHLLSSLAPEARIWAIPTGVDTCYFTPDGTREGQAEIVFTGSMDWYPNEDAMLHFIAAVLPQIRAQVPEVCLTVVGRNPSARLWAAAREANVQVTGTVDDIRPYVAAATTYVVPLRVGGGTRLKIFEALAMGKAVVSTQIGAEGLPLTPGEHFLQADDPSEFAQAVISLLRDPERRKALGRAGRRLVEKRYGWPQVAREFESKCEEVIACHAR